MQQEEGMEALADEGNFYNLEPVDLSHRVCYPLFLFLIFLAAISIVTFHISGEDEALEDFLAEDREEELKWHKTSMAETRKLVRDVMQKDWGWGEVVHPEKAKELILQVTISF